MIFSQDTDKTRKQLLKDKKKLDKMLNSRNLKKCVENKVKLGISHRQDLENQRAEEKTNENFTRMKKEGRHSYIVELPKKIWK